VGFARIAGLLLSAVGVRLAGAVVGLVLQIVLARWLTPTEMGGWFVIMSLASFAGLLISAGYPTLGLAVLARYHARGQDRMAGQFMQKAAYDIGKYALLMALPAIAFLLMAPVSDVSRLAVIAGLVVAPAAAIIRLNGSAANALRRYMLTIVPDFIGKSVLLLGFVALYVMATGRLTLDVVAAAFIVLSYLTAWITGKVLKGHGVTGLGRDTSSVRLGKTWASRAAPLIIVAMALMAMADYLTLVATLLLPKADVALVGIAIRLAALIGFFTQASQQFVLRDLAGALHVRDAGQARSLLMRTNIACVSVIAAALVGFAVLGEWFLALFGPGYVAAQPVLMLLMLAQGVRAIGGINVHLLSLGGGQAMLGRTCLASAVIILALASLLVPVLGITGIGWAAIAGELVWIMAVAVQTRERIGWRGDFLALFSQDNRIGQKPLPVKAAMGDAG
jgi:O-antigen/teichoic acid export membrane protein